MPHAVSFQRKRAAFKRWEIQQRFLHSPWSGGVVLVIFAVLALILANLPWTKEFYHHLREANLTVGFISKSIEEWVNDWLMVLFFFYVGLEIKREIIAGQLSKPKQAVLPIVAAIGGMVVPGLIYNFFNQGEATHAGWGIPMATDIAFAIGVLSLLGNRVPVSLKVFLTAAAIVDDLGGMLVIALFYSTSINYYLLAAAAAILLLMIVLNRLNVYRMGFYLIPSIILWVLFLFSGVHATLSGVLVAMTLPSTPRFSQPYFIYKARFIVESFRHHQRTGTEVLANPRQLNDLFRMRHIAMNSISPSQRLEHSLHHTVAFFIMPVFALVNAGVEIANLGELKVLSHPQGLGIFFGLVVGKPIGIMLFSWIMVKLGWGQLPAGSDWKSMLGVAILGGIGFTMSIFIDNLAFHDPSVVDTGKIAILIASFTAAIIGLVYMRIALKKKKTIEM